MKKQTYTVTAALPYANGPLHLGHVAGVYLPADIFVRFLKMKKENVLFVCASDEHGAAITLRAKKEGITPQEIVDKYHEINKKAFADFGIEFDIYSRTSNQIHHETAQEYFKVLEDKGSFVKKTTEQYYDQKFDQFLADRYITGTCPNCGNENAYGDQCENCGSALSPTDLINPVSTLSGDQPVLKETSHWFLPMERHEDWLRTWIKEGKLDGVQQHDPKEWRNQVNGQCMSWIDGGLHARAMTRDLDWGVKVPVKDAEGKVLYVWLDAPIGYISATKEWASENGKDWKDYWTDDAKLIHFIGKDNIVFHAIIFPILLKEHGGFVLPNNVPAYEFLNLEGDKFSTSRNWAVWLHEFIEAHPQKVDELKYVLTSIAPENKDAEFTWKEFKDRINNELADILGNFINRVAVLTHKYYKGEIPRLSGDSVYKEYTDAIAAFPDKIEKSIRQYKLREAQAEVMNLARLGNKFFAETEPWKLFKTEPEKVADILNITLQIAANLSILLRPFLPKKAETIAAILNYNETNWEIAGVSDLLPAGHLINKSQILVEKISDDFVAAEVEKLEATKQAGASTNHEPQKDTIAFDDFMKMDIRVGQITAAEKVPKADKLLKLTVDTGLDQRTVVSGIAEHYSPEEVVGKRVSLLMNLAPRKIRGVESQGMILMAEDNEGNLSFVSPEKDVQAGSEIR